MYTWEEVENYINICNACPLSKTRINPVMGRGSHTKGGIMFIAEAPGAKEDLSGIPFVGPAGEMLDKMLKYADLSRDDIYITNIVKCHPPHNREPADSEKETCFPYLRYETFLLKPSVIVCLGRVAAQKIISPDFRITKQHGTWTYRKGTALTAVYHPSALLRDPSKFEITKNDFINISEKYDELSMHHIISDKDE